MSLSIPLGPDMSRLVDAFRDTKVLVWSMPFESDRCGLVNSSIITRVRISITFPQGSLRTCQLGYARKYKYLSVNLFQAFRGWLFLNMTLLLGLNHGK